MTIHEMREAVQNAKNDIRKVEEMADDLAFMLRGKLRHVISGSHLKALKRELQDYNMHTGYWKEKP